MLHLIRVNNPIFVGNERYKIQKLNKIFGIIPVIKTPSNEANSKINEVVEELVNVQNKIEESNYGAVIIAMGCTGRVLVKRMIKTYNFNSFYLDFGSLLDGIFEYQSRSWLKKNNIDYYDILLKGLT